MEHHQVLETLSAQKLDFWWPKRPIPTCESAGISLLGRWVPTPGQVDLRWTVRFPTGRKGRSDVKSWKLFLIFGWIFEHVAFFHVSYTNLRFSSFDDVIPVAFVWQRKWLRWQSFGGTQVSHLDMAMVPGINAPSFCPLSKDFLVHSLIVYD